MKKSIVLFSLTTICAMLTAQNPFLDYQNWKTPHDTYPFDAIKVEHYMPAFDEGIKQGLAEIDAIANNPAAPTFANTIEAYEKAGKLLSVVASCFYNLTSAETNDSLAALELELSPKLSEYSSTILLNEKLFERIKTVYEQKDKLKLTAEQSKMLDDIYEGFANNGANLSAEDKEQFKALQAKLSKLTLVYGQNVLKATNAWTRLIKDESLLAGLSDDTKQMLHANAAKKGLDGWLLDLKPTTYIPVMKYCDNRDIRRELYMAYNTRCIGGEFDNTQNIKEIVNTRLALANLFGKACYADKSLHKTMAETKENVYRLLDQLRDAYMPVARAEYDELQQFADSLGFYATLQAWDWSYYSEKLKNETYALSDDELRPYFELENVKKGVFNLANKLYGLTFVKNPNIQVYHPEVDAYDVFDAKGKFLAVYYCDFHPRDGKRGGAWMNDYKPQYRDGKTDSRPHIVNVMNFTRATADKPALLTYDEVETFLHEFGHGLHGMLTRCQYASMSGTNVPRDFVELPSQFNENFLGEKAFLDTFAKHYLTGEPMPQALIDKIKAAQNYHAAYACARQLSFGYLDMAWHTITEPFDGDVIAFGNAAMEQVKVLPVVPETQMETAFTHIFAGGYAAGYYSYKWSEVLDADAFSVFKKNGIFDKKTADSFRTNILERGGTEPAMTLYKRFRGQEPTVDALMERDGIKKND
ncbi:MAG: M3 family metallopeptidase [Paludibacteraceae bacterium]|nr:M3 family metallopeptidase [Paludibacteraceae bacterium]